jgi:hypothetical protein
MDKNFQLGILTDERASSSGVVQMDVRQEHGAEVGNTQAMLSELLAENIKGRSGAGIDKRRFLLRAEKSGRDRTRMANPLKIKSSGGMHGKSECSAARAAFPIRAAGSDGRCNTCLKFTRWSLES